MKLSYFFRLFLLPLYFLFMTQFQGKILAESSGPPPPISSGVCACTGGAVAACSYPTCCCQNCPPSLCGGGTGGGGGVPELPGGNLYLLIGGASGALFWVRRFFKR